MLRHRYQTLELEGVDIHIRTLRDKQEFEDPDGLAKALGIPEASWSLFGVLWESGKALAELMLGYQINGRRVLEVGCGIGLASLVLNSRKADITATDSHPFAAAFLAHNVMLNGGPEIPFERASWVDLDDNLGFFDLIIGSDLLYERQHSAELSGFITRHARSTCEVVLIDPGRGEVARFSKTMIASGFSYERLALKESRFANLPKRGRFHRYLR